MNGVGDASAEKCVEPREKLVPRVALLAGGRRDGAGQRHLAGTENCFEKLGLVREVVVDRSLAHTSGPRDVIDRAGEIPVLDELVRQL